MLFSPVLHATDPAIGWHFYPSVVVGVLALLGVYFAAAGRLRMRFKGSQKISRWRILAYVAGVLAIFFALVSPLDSLGDTYLFSAHMIQHLILTSLAAPLLILGTPGWMLRPVLDRPVVKPAFRALTNPIVAFLIYSSIYIGWHFPIFYQAALENENIHAVQHLMFLAAAVINWWPVLSHMKEFPPLPLPLRMVYLFLEGMPVTILGVVLAFSDGVLYPFYTNAPLRLWGLSIISDQQMGGLIMWMTDEAI